MSPRALACPASLKGCLAAGEAAERLAAGFRRAGWEVDVLPIADGGEGTVDVLCSAFEEVETVDAFGLPRVARVGVRDDGTRVVEAAEAIPLDPSRLDVMAASSRGLGLWIARYRDCPLDRDRRRHGDDGRGRSVARGAGRAAGPDARVVRRGNDAVRRAAALRAAEGGDTRAGRRARGSVPGGRTARTGRVASGFGSRRRSRGGARVARRRARPRCGRGARSARLRPAALRPRRDRRGHGRRDDMGGEGACRGRAPMCGRGRSLRHLRRAGRGRDRPRGSVPAGGGAQRRPGAGARRPRGAGRSGSG